MLLAKRIQFPIELEDQFTTGTHFRIGFQQTATDFDPGLVLFPLQSCKTIQGIRIQNLGLFKALAQWHQPSPR